MTRPAIYTDAARGLLGAFVGRNNDIDGYWALGKLYAHARHHRVDEVDMDVLRSTLAPPAWEFEGMLVWLRGRLAHQLVARSIAPDHIASARIAVRFTGVASEGAWGEVFQCRVTLVDERGRPHHAETTGACWVHDPFREGRRARPNRGDR